MHIVWKKLLNFESNFAESGSTPNIEIKHMWCSPKCGLKWFRMQIMLYFWQSSKSNSKSAQIKKTSYHMVMVISGLMKLKFENSSITNYPDALIFPLFSCEWRLQRLYYNNNWWFDNFFSLRFLHSELARSTDESISKILLIRPVLLLWLIRSILTKLKTVI